MLRVFIFFIALFLLSYSPAHADRCEKDTLLLWRIDSITKELSYTHPDSAINMVWSGIQILKKCSCPDSVKDYQYGNMTFRMASCFLNKEDYALSLEYYRESLKMYLRHRYFGAAADAFHQIGYVYMMMDNYEDALMHFKSAFTINRLRKREDASKNLINMGNCYIQLGRYEEALDAFINSLKLKEAQGDKKGVANCMFNLGAVHYILKNNREALDYYYKVLEQYTNDSNVLGQAQVYNNVGLIYMGEKKYDLAEESYNNALKLYSKLDKPRKVGATLSNLGKNAYLQKDFKKAWDYYNQYNIIAQKLGDKSSLAYTYQNLGSVEKEIGNYQNALDYFFRGLKMTEELGVVHEKDRIYFGIAETYHQKGDYRNAAEWYSKYVFFRDSLYNIEKSNQMSELEKKFQTERKQKEIELQQEQLKRQQAEIDIQTQISEKQRFQRNAFIAGFVLSLFIVFLVFRSYLHKKRTNKILTQQKEEIETQRDRLANLNAELSQKNEEISAQRDEIETQRDMLEVRKNQVEKINREITDSIRYARRIQGAMMPGENQLSEILPDYFLLFRPRDIVSGDFYWAGQRGEWLIFCVADCTGHGVPGAFMSLLGISYLNEIVKNKQITTTSAALNELRNLVVESLKQQDSLRQENVMSGIKDGMDIALCVLNTRTLELQFSGANNACWIVQKENGFTELPADKMPVAIHTVMDTFTEKSIRLEKGDMVYLMSDGYADQFGGKQGRKFMKKALRDSIIANAGLPCDDQKNSLEKTLLDWMDGHPQVDDVTILGIRI